MLTSAQAEAARRLKTLYEAKKKLLGITQQSIADELDITQGAVGHYLNGRNPLNPAVALVFARLLKVDVAEFSPALAKELAGMGVVSVNDPTTPYRVNFAPDKKYPVLRTFPVTAWDKVSEICDAEDVELWLDADIEILGEAFWLKMEGNAMTAPAGLSVPDGYFVLFDTGRKPSNNSLVLASLPGASEVTFKKLIVDGGQMYLAGLNPQWPLTPIDSNCRFIGVALESRLRLIQA